MAKWPYNTPEWNRLREQKLKHSPVCEHCDRRGKLVTANTIDHVVAISKGGPPFPGLDGLMSLCATCHNQKTAAVDKLGSSGLSLKGCGPDGLPLDPAHHAWGDTPSQDGQSGSSDRGGARAHTYFEKARRPWD